MRYVRGRLLLASVALIAVAAGCTTGGGSGVAGFDEFIVDFARQVAAAFLF
ncbi:MAG: hypothetical protein ACREXT_09940 [Gammaproteobacteria bacterium]